MKNILILGEHFYGTPFLNKGNLFYISHQNFNFNSFSKVNWDYVVFTGGEDISPHLYGEKLNIHTYFSALRDKIDIQAIKWCFKRSIPTIGICRGMQLQTVANNGKLIQNVNGHGRSHLIYTSEGKNLQVNSLHHQMCYLENASHHKLLAWSTKVSSSYEGENNYFYSNIDKEPEAIWFPETKCLGVQFHPEMMDELSKGYIYFQNLIDLYIG